MALTVGFLGLGRMGEPMSRNLLAAGFPVVVFDIDEDKCARLKEAGATVAGSPADVARQSEVSLAIVMNDAVLEQVALADDGVLAGAAPGHVFCDLSTVSPRISTRIAERARETGAHYLRGKVAGSTGLAKEGTLTIFASGDRADYETMLPVFEAMGRKILFVGDSEAAHYLKLVHSIIVGVYAGMLGEALAFGEKGGVDLGLMVDVLESGPLGSILLTGKADALKAHDFDTPPSDIDTAAKDMDLIIEAARDLAVPMPLTVACRAIMSHQQAVGEGKRDIFAVLEAYERLAGLRAGASA